MAKPLTVKNPGNASTLELCIVGALTAVPLIYVKYLTRFGGQVHSNNPSANFLLHASLIILPMLWAGIILRKPFEFQESDETILERQTFFTTFRNDWWNMLLLWATPLFCLMAFAYEASKGLFSRAPAWTTSPQSAGETFALVLALSLMFGTIMRAC